MYRIKGANFNRLVKATAAMVVTAVTATEEQQQQLQENGERTVGCSGRRLK